VQAAVGDGALVHPRAEHRADRAPQLRLRILWERLAALLLQTLLVACDKLDPVLGGELGIEGEAVAVLVIVEQLLEQMMLDPQHHVGIHGDEPPVAVIGEARVARLPGQCLDGHVVEPEVEHRIHHAGHRGARARAHRDEQRVRVVAEDASGPAADLGERGLDLRPQPRRILASARIIGGADLGRDGEARRYRQAEIGHLGKARPLAAEEIAHVGAPFRLAGPEGIDPFGRARRSCVLRALRRLGRRLGGARHGRRFLPRLRTRLA